MRSEENKLWTVGYLIQAKGEIHFHFIKLVHLFFFQHPLPFLYSPKGHYNYPVEERKNTQKTYQLQ